MFVQGAAEAPRRCTAAPCGGADPARGRLGLSGKGLRQDRWWGQGYSAHGGQGRAGRRPFAPRSRAVTGLQTHRVAQMSGWE